MISEFQLIEKYFTRQSVARTDVELGIGDDAALLKVPEGETLAVSIDTLVEGVHFFPASAPEDLGYRALAVNLSDMAAMGAQPAWATLALSLPEVNEAWLEGFAKGFFSLAAQHQVQLVGGNTTRGARSITIQMHGFVPRHQALCRTGARPGDLIYVTGTLGDAGLGLKILRGELSVHAADSEYALKRYYRPTARVAEGLALRGIASAAIDISDGLLADLGHILDASGVGARITVDALPVTPAFRSVQDRVGGWNLPLNAGDDYELCFTVPAEWRGAAERAVGVATCIGVIEAQRGLRCALSDGRVFVPARGGFEHFSSVPHE